MFDSMPRGRDKVLLYHRLQGWCFLALPLSPLAPYFSTTPVHSSLINGIRGQTAAVFTDQVVRFSFMDFLLEIEADEYLQLLTVSDEFLSLLTLSSYLRGRRQIFVPSPSSSFSPLFGHRWQLSSLPD